MTVRALTTTGIRLRPDDDRAVRELRERRRNRGIVFGFATFRQRSLRIPMKFGTSGRDIITAPSWTNFDISAFKNFSLTERTVLQFPFI